QGGRSRRPVHAHAGERERQVDRRRCVPVLRGRADREGGVQDRVEERRVKAEARRLGPLVICERDFGEQLFAVAPGRLETLERGAVREAEVRQTIVQQVRLDRLGVWRGPLPGRGRVQRLARGRKRAARVARPLELLGRVV